MKLAIMQPYFLPYIGYWQLIHAVDKFVLYDDVNYIKGGWINRNNILANGKKQRFTIRLDDSSSFKLIKEIGILDDFIKFQKTIQMNYHKAPYFDAVMRIIAEIIGFDKSDTGKFIYNSVRVIADYLGITTELLLSSDLDKDNSLKAQDKVIDICKKLGASEYYNAIGGTDLYSVDVFGENGIDLKFIQTRFTPYTQFKNEFVAGLSILDIMMFNDAETIQKMLGEYSLV
jgi:hypothetical protein